MNKCSGNDIFIDETRGEVICVSTGEVVDTLVDYYKEWRTFEGSYSTRPRNGPPLSDSVHDKGLSTDIGKEGPYYYSNRLAKINSRVRIQGKRRFVKALQLIREEARRMHLPQNVVSTASRLIREVINLGLGRGNMLRSYVLSALYLSCKLNKIPRSFSEFVRYAIKNEGVSGKEEIITIKKLRYAYRKIIEINRERYRQEMKLKVYKPQDYINILANSLNLSPGSITLMYRLSKASEKLNLTQGKSPLALLGAIAYISSGIMGEKRRQRDIADIFETFTDVAIRNRYRELIDALYIEVSL